MAWMYLIAASGVLVLLRIVFSIVIASERVVAKTERRAKHRALRDRVGRFTR